MKLTEKKPLGEILVKASGLAKRREESRLPPLDVDNARDHLNPWREEGRHEEDEINSGEPGRQHKAHSRSEHPTCSKPCHASSQVSTMPARSRLS